jgi:TetR/AcrR family transcriptional repressor of bet genes
MTVTNNLNMTARARQKKITRSRIIEATFDVIAEEGFAGVTMAKVAERAGLSRGIGNFHFKTKEQLLLEALKVLYGEFEMSWRSAISDAGPSPVDQLTGLIRKILEPPIADPKKIALWLAYWGETPSRQTYMELCDAYDRQWEAAIEEILHSLIDDNFDSHGMSLHAIGESLIAMMDGFWLEYLLAPDRFTPEDAVKACIAFLSSFFPKFRTANP